MSDQTSPPPVPAPTPVPFPPGSTPMSEREVNEGKAMAVISYALNFPRFPFWLVPLIMRNNDFALYHAKQCMVLWLFALAASLVTIPFFFLCGIGLVMLLAVAVFVIVLNIIGLVNAIGGQAKPLPMIGLYGEKWFIGIRKTQS